MSSRLSHTIYVTRLYRRALRTCRDWYIGVDAYRKITLAVRHEFEKYRNLQDREHLRFLLACTESILNRARHPEPLVSPNAVGGAAHERDAIIPKQIIEDGYYDFKDSVR